MDQYMALSKKDLMIHITLNELYNTHSLLSQHIDTLVSGHPFSAFRTDIDVINTFSRPTTSNISGY